MLRVQLRMSCLCMHVLSQVAPVLRFMDVGYNANVKIEDIGTPDKIIAGFAPELFGRPLNDDEVKNTKTWVQDGATYYGW